MVYLNTVLVGFESEHLGVIHKLEGPLLLEYLYQDALSELLD